MVFTKVLIIKGTLLEETDIYDLGRYLYEIFPNGQLGMYMENLSKGDKKSQKSKKNNDDHYGKVRHTIENINGTIGHWNYNIYRCPYCSGLQNKFILGTLVKSYHRLKIKCDECEKYTSCDKCLGMTENGYYDVETISENVVQLPNECVCFACGNDKKCDSPCKFCNYETLGKTCEIEEHTLLDKRLDGFLRNREIGYYYMLDDCLVCS